ncbi:hypothetical protein V8E36_000686 [Tilletia maclaganii]
MASTAATSSHAAAAAAAATGPRGIELLTIDSAELWEATPTAHSASTDTASPPQLTTRLAQGKLTALLVTIDVNDPVHSAGGTNTDLWLVLTLRDQGSASDVPFPILASQRVIAHRPTHSYRFINPPHQAISTSGNTDVVLKLTSVFSTGTASEKTPFDLDPAAEAYFEDILAQYCAFEEPDDVAPPPPFSAAAATTPGSGSRNSANGAGVGHGEIELFDQDGKLIGHLEGSLDEHPDLRRDALASSRDGGDAKSPVLIDLSNAGNTGAFASGSSSSSGGAPTSASAVRVSPLREGDIEATKLGAGEKEEVDWMIHSAQFIGRTLVKGSVYLGGKLTSAADSYIERNPSKHSSANNTPRTGSPAPMSPSELQGSSRSDAAVNGFRSGDGVGAHSRYARTPAGDKSRSAMLTKYSSKAVSISQSTTSAILNVASNVGDRVGKATGIQRQQRPDGTMGPPPKGVRGVLNRGIIAASSLLDSIEQAGENLLTDGGSAASRVIGHKYGADAERRAGNVASSGRNVYMVYKDIMGVRRRCLIRAAVGSSLKARTPEGEVVEVKLGPGGGSGTVTPAGAGTGPGTGWSEKQVAA